MVIGPFQLTNNLENEMDEKKTGNREKNRLGALPKFELP